MSILSSINKRTRIAMLKQCTIQILSEMLKLSSSSGENVTLSLSRIKQAFSDQIAKYILSNEMKRCDIHNNSDLYDILETEACFILKPTTQDRLKVETAIQELNSDIELLESNIDEATGKKGRLIFYNTNIDIHLTLHACLFHRGHFTV